MDTTWWQLIFEASDALRDYATTHCDTNIDKITVAQTKIFGVVFRHPEGLKLKDIARALHLTPGAVSQSIEVLVRDGMLERFTNPDDRRAVVIRPTDKLEYYRRLNHEKFSEIMAAVLRECTRSEQNAYVKIMNKIVEKTRAAHAALETAPGAPKKMEEPA